MIILFNPASNPARKKILPMSLLALGATLEGRHDYMIVDGNAPVDSLGALAHLIENLPARFLGVSVMPGPQLAQAVPICRELKKRYPHLTVIWGGYFPSMHPEPCLESGVVDFVLRGHADHALVNLMDALEKGADLSGVPGLAWRDQAGLRMNELPAIPHPQELPQYPYHRLPMADYVRSGYLGRRILSHHTSYGCPFTCNFCAVVTMVNGRWKALSAVQVASTVERLKHQFNIDAVEFYDNNFFVHEERTAEIAQRMRPWNLHWWGEARVDTLLAYSSRTWQTMKQSGLKMVFLGAESGSSESLQAVNKGGSVSAEKIRELNRAAKSWGIVPEFSFMLGLPPHPEKDAHGSMELIRELKEFNPACEIILYICTPVPLEGNLYRQAQDHGLSWPRTLQEWLEPKWMQFAMHRTTDTPWMDRRLVGKIRGFERVLNSYYPTVTDPRWQGLWRWVLKGFSSWRYHLKIYRYPVELDFLQRALHYQRPETAGF